MVREAAAAVNPIAPERLRRSSFDAYRRTLDPAPPSGRVICERLGYRWRELVRVATDGDRDLDQTLLMRSRTGRQEWTDAQIARAVRAIAHRLGATTVRPDQYRAEREAILEASARRIHGTARREFPTFGQIERSVGWEGALELAGLERYVINGTPAGRDWFQVIHEFIDEHAMYPLPGAVEVYAERRGFSLARSPLGGWRAHRDLITQQRAERGLTIPQATCTRRMARELPIELDDSPAVRRRARPPWDLTQCQQALIAATRLLPTGQDLRQATYRQLQAEHREDWPSASVIDRHARKAGTTFTALRDHAQEVVRAERAPNRTT